MIEENKVEDVIEATVTDVVMEEVENDLSVPDSFDAASDETPVEQQVVQSGGMARLEPSKKDITIIFTDEQTKEQGSYVISTDAYFVSEHLKDISRKLETLVERTACK